jgi:hypothetical protein
MGTTVGGFDVLAPFEAGVEFHGVGLRDADAWLARDGIFAARNSDKRAAFKGGRVSECDFGQPGGFAGEGEIFPEREVRIAFPHEDAAEVGVVTEADAHHVVDFAFVPVGSPPHCGKGGHFAFFFGNLGIEAQIAEVAIAVKMINEGKSRVVTVVVDAGNIDEVIEAKFRFSEGANIGQPLGVGELECQLASELGGSGKQVAEPGLKLLG